MNRSPQRTILKDYANWESNKKKLQQEIEARGDSKRVSIGLNSRYLATLGTMIATTLAFLFGTEGFYWVILIVALALHIFSSSIFNIEDRMIAKLTEKKFLMGYGSKAKTVKQLKMKAIREIPNIIGNLYTVVIMFLIIMGW